MKRSSLLFFLILALLFSVPLPLYAQLCNPGSFSATGEEPCQFCDEGTYQPDSGQTSCLQCPNGTFAPNQNSISCLLCPAGFGSNHDFSDCQQCDIGTFSPEDGAGCSSCAAGSYAADPGSLSCDLCPAGLSSDSGASSCMLCAAGNFSVEGGLCLPCPAGSHSADAGTADCSPCAPGSSSEEGATSCSLCPKGFHQADEGAVSCEPCPSNTFAFEDGAESCSECRALPRLQRLLVRNAMDGAESNTVILRGNLRLRGALKRAFRPRSAGVSLLIESEDRTPVVDLVLEEGKSNWAVRRRDDRIVFNFRRNTNFPQVRRARFTRHRGTRPAQVSFIINLQEPYGFDAETRPATAVFIMSSDSTACASRIIPGNRCKYRTSTGRWLCR